MVLRGSTIAPLWLMLLGSSDLVLLVVVCVPQLGPELGPRMVFVLMFNQFAALVKLDKWITGGTDMGGHL